MQAAIKKVNSILARHSIGIHTLHTPLWHIFVASSEALCSLQSSVSGMYYSNNVPAIFLAVISYNQYTISQGNSITYQD